VSIVSQLPLVGLDIVLPMNEERMFPNRENLVHDYTCGPDVDSFCVLMVACSNLRGHIYDGSALLVHSTIIEFVLR
jgi:hypothetical protein